MCARAQSLKGLGAAAHESLRLTDEIALAASRRLRPRLRQRQYFSRTLLSQYSVAEYSSSITPKRQGLLLVLHRYCSESYADWHSGKLHQAACNSTHVKEIIFNLCNLKGFQ